MEVATRRTGRRNAVIEWLEDRTLLSVIAPSVVPRLAAAGRAEVAPPIEVRWLNETKNRPTTSKSVATTPIRVPVSTSKLNGASAGLTTVDWIDLDSTSLSVPSLLNSGTTGGTAQAAQAAQDASIDDESDDDGGLDTLSDLYFAEWASSNLFGKGRSLSNRAGLAISLYGQSNDEDLLTTALRRAWASSVTTSVILLHGHSPAAQDLGRISLESQAGAKLLHDGSGPGRMGQAGPASAGTRPEMAELLDGVGSLEWERLDHDLRRLLARVGGIPSIPVGPEHGSVLPTLIAILMTSLVARETARREGWWRQRFVPRVRLVGGDPDSAIDPIGPWPLGLP
ncbi:hypothetical protein [Singulisphaera sp. GP187]|uniref:hypothetical protein n=1 Tax=Singulisphaera sp. GP187 TaxID=1882752 RepID=UPI0020B16D8F|nr:hypothetical protein [Singulisphaera sp. GP187]